MLNVLIEQNRLKVKSWHNLILCYFVSIFKFRSKLRKKGRKNKIEPGMKVVYKNHVSRSHILSRATTQSWLWNFLGPKQRGELICSVVMLTWKEIFLFMHLVVLYWCRLFYQNQELIRLWISQSRQILQHTLTIHCIINLHLNVF